MTIVYAVANLKGGIGKTATAQALGAGLASKGKRVLLIDLDNQIDLSIATGRSSYRDQGTIYEVINGICEAEQTIQPIKKNLDIIIASEKLSMLETTLVQTGKEYRLKEVLAPIKGMYDYIVIDCPPSLDIRTLNALTFADQIIIPTKGDLFGYQAVRQTLNAVDVIREYTNPGLKVAGILLTQYNPRTILHPYYKALVQESNKVKVFKSTIRNSITVADAQASMQDVISYAPSSNVAKDYQAFIKELIKK